MKMPKEVFENHFSDMRKVMQEIADTGLKPVPSVGDIDLSNLTMRDMWAIQLKVFLDRANEDHPMYGVEGVLGRVLEFNDRSIHDLYNDHDLLDTHIETAFREMIRCLEADPIVPTQKLSM